MDILFHKISDNPGCVDLSIPGQFNGLFLHSPIDEQSLPKVSTLHN